MSEQSIAASRWLAKKAARAAVGLSGSMTSAVRPARAPEVRVLTYHRFGPSRRMPFTVTAAQFEAEMAYLSAHDLALSLGALEEFLAGRREVKPGSVVVTIDDGDPSVRRVALPILRAHKTPAVLYALAGRPAGFDLATDAELRELREGGVEIGSHSINHGSLATMPLAEAAIEVRESKARLEDRLGAAVTSFAYPFGTRRDVSPEVADLIAEAGYGTAFTSLHGPVTPQAAAGRGRYLLPRIKVESGDPAWLFPALCGGAMDGWRLIDMGLSSLQKPA